MTAVDQSVELTVQEAAHHLSVRAQKHCDGPKIYWSLLDVNAVWALVRKARELGFLEDDG